MPIVSLLVIHCAYLISKIEVEPSLSLIIYATICRHICFLPTLAILGIDTRNLKKQLKVEQGTRGFSWINSFAKINYVSFLSHYPVINIMIGDLNQKQTLLVWMVTKLLIATMVVGTFLYFFFDQPIQNSIELWNQHTIKNGKNIKKVT